VCDAFDYLRNIDSIVNRLPYRDIAEGREGIGEKKHDTQSRFPAGGIYFSVFRCCGQLFERWVETELGPPSPYFR
jgi:hypothetical protein